MLFCGKDKFEKENREGNRNDEEEVNDCRFMSKMIKILKKEVNEEREQQELDKRKVMKFKREQSLNTSSKFGSQGYTKRSQGAILSGARKLQANLERENISLFSTASNRD